MMKRFIRTATALERDERGAALILVTLALPMIFGAAAFAIDLGYAFYINSRIQHAADLAALAGGTKLVQGDKVAVETQALDYVELNLPSNWDILDEEGNVIRGTGNASIKITERIVADCSTKLRDETGVTCYAAPGLTKPINYVKVSLDAATPLFFASGLGFHNISLTSDAVVTGEGSTMPPLNVAIVLDTTASMVDPNDMTMACDNVSMTKLACAKKAALGMLTTLWPVVDQAALYTYPGLSQGSGSSPSATTANQNAAKNICSSGTPVVTDYKKDSNPAKYQVVGFKDDYRDKNSPPRTSSNTQSDLVKALGGTTGCKGLQVGTTDGSTYTPGSYSNIVWTFYADTIAQAQADLKAANAALPAGQPTRQNVIVILSDGDANASTTFIESTSSRRYNQCLQAITEAQAAAAEGTWVYSVAYNASTITGSGSGASCKLDTSTVTLAAQTATVTTRTSTTTTTQAYNKNLKRCDTAQTSQPQVTTQNRTVSLASVAGTPASVTTGPTTNPNPPPTCSSNNRNISYTTTTTTVSWVTDPPPTTTSYDRSACDTMRAMASSPDKFFSIDPPGRVNGCVSEANPTTTDLLSIFKKVAVSMMKKRRAPKSAI